MNRKKINKRYYEKTKEKRRDAYNNTPYKYKCEPCNFKARIISSFKNHCKTKKHIKNCHNK